MRKILLCGIASLLFLVTASPLSARGGGGCLKQGTPVLTPSGNVPVEQLKPGDTVIGISRGKLAPARVQSVTTVQPDQYIQIIVNSRITLYVTHEHPIQITYGVFRMASALKTGDTVSIMDRNTLAFGTVTSITRMPVQAPAYNLLVSPVGDYVANGIVVHNKGCFLPDTPIRMADGSELPLSEIKQHDRVLAFKSDGQVVPALVRTIITYDVDEYQVVRAGNRVLQVTNEHPFYVGNGTFKTLEALNVGDSIFIFDGKGLSSQRIESIETVHKKTRVYNLQTDAPHTYLANGVAVHNKGGGCFPAGTKITTPTGKAPIEHIQSGASVIAIDQNGLSVVAVVKETHATKAPLVLISTPFGVLKTTTEHPIALAAGGFRPAGALSVNDEIMTVRKGKVLQTVVKEVKRTAIQEDVYNLTVDWPHTFVADGFIVHNKGGGGFHGGGYHSGSSRGDSGNYFEFVITFIIIFGVIYYIVDGVSKGRSQENLDFAYSAAQIAKKRDKTMKLLAFIKKQDSTVAPENLQKVTEATFLKLQECWQAREYAPMKPLLMPDLYNEHLLQIQGMVHNHELNLISQLKIDRTDLVNVRYTLKEEEREFTALITATAQDYYIDDRTKARLRGDEKPARFQEFWTFHYFNKAWLLREIEQTRESEVLKEDNFFEQFTDKGVEHVYGDTASKEGPAGPWLEKEVETKETRVERMLNFLALTDKLWDRAAMLLIARNVFIKVAVAWESGDPSKVPADDLYPELADNLRKELALNREAEIEFEFRNLCVRKTELILIRNFADNSKDVFVVRVRAHAQKIMKRKSVIVRQDGDVAPFEQYLTFGRLGKKWKLKEILNSSVTQGLIKQENVDEESSPRQIQWYYQHKRAM